MPALVMTKNLQLWMVVKIYNEGGSDELSDEPMAVFFDERSAIDYRQKLYREMTNQGISWIINCHDSELMPDWDTDDVEYYYAIKRGKLMEPNND